MVDAVVDKAFIQCYIIARCNNSVTNEVLFYEQKQTEMDGMCIGGSSWI